MYRGVRPRWPCDPVLFKDFSELWSSPLSTSRTVHSGVIEISLLGQGHIRSPKAAQSGFQIRHETQQQVEEQRFWVAWMLPTQREPCYQGSKRASCILVLLEVTTFWRGVKGLGQVQLDLTRHDFSHVLEVLTQTVYKQSIGINHANNSALPSI